MMTATPHPLTSDSNNGFARRFADAMAGLGPFEARPHLAVAVSGGADSTALALLAHDWARARGGQVTALTVDHGLRDGSAAEARTATGRLAALGITAHVLTWSGAKPGTAVQAAARSARYGLLRAWCRDAGVLHLLAGHHADDQMETHLMRISRGGPLGAAGMSALVEFPEVRLLRPLLGFSRAGLAGFLRGLRVAWIEDPSNVDDVFERVRVRRRLAGDTALADAVRAETAHAGEARIALERAVNGALAATIFLHPLGVARLDRQAFRDLPGDVAAALAGRLAQVLGGADHAPPAARTERLATRLSGPDAFPGASLGRCRFLAEKDGRIVVCRDRRGLPAPMSAMPGRVSGWDGRYVVDIPAGIDEGAVLAPLGDDGWRQVPRDLRRAWGLLPAAAHSLPALFRNGELAAHALGLGQGELAVRFRPKNSLAFNGFCIA